MFKISYIYDLVDNISHQLKKIQSNLQQVNNKVAQTAQSMSTSLNKIGDSLNDPTLTEKVTENCIIRYHSKLFKPNFLAQKMFLKNVFIITCLSLASNTLPGNQEVSKIK